MRIETLFVQRTAEAPPAYSAVRQLGLPTVSTLQSEGECGLTLCRIVAAPGIVVGAVCSFVLKIFRNSIFCCCRFRSRHRKLNWQATAIVCKELISHLEAAESRQRAFDQTLKQLSKPAQELFLFHLGLAIAKEKGCADRASQEKYLVHSSIDYRKTLGAFEKNRELVRQAVDSFASEVIRNIKG